MSSIRLTMTEDKLPAIGLELEPQPCRHLNYLSVFRLREATFNPLTSHPVDRVKSLLPLFIALPCGSGFYREGSGTPGKQAELCHP